MLANQCHTQYTFYLQRKWLLVLMHATTQQRPFMTCQLLHWCTCYIVWILAGTVHVRVRACMRACVSYVCVCVHAYVCAHMCICVCVHVCVSV